MPIEIRELVIRARVDPCDEPPRRADRAARRERERERERQLVRSCVQEVMRILEDERER